jgi:gamma-glutamyltranspeptidase/glutathione hydrolase
VEAAIAVAATIAVTYPHMNSIGGDGFWVIHRPGQPVTAIDACGAAAQKADLALYAGLDAVPWRGLWRPIRWRGRSPAGPRRVRSRRAHCPLAPARRSHRLWPGGRERDGRRRRQCRGQKRRTAQSTRRLCRYLRARRPPLLEGERLRQPALAQTLERLAQEGLDSFIAAIWPWTSPAIWPCWAARCPPPTLPPTAAETEPLSVQVKGATLFNHQPPTQGIASLLILALADRLDLGRDGSFAHVHGLVEATKRAFLWRDAHCGDPAYMDADPRACWPMMPHSMRWPRGSTRSTPCHGPCPASRATRCGSARRTRTAWSSRSSRAPISNSDRALSCPHGYHMAEPGASFRLAQDGWNALKPGRKPFHTLNPALARFDDGRVMAYGTMGGEGQPQTQAALFTRNAGRAPIWRRRLPPRAGCWAAPGAESTSLKIEEGFDEALYTKLAQAGHVVERVAANNSMMGHAGAIITGDGWFEGASDPRSDGRAAGL